MKMNSAKLELTSVDVAQLIVFIRGEFKPMADKKKVKIIVRLKETLPMVRADYGQLMHALRNLMNNAIKFNRENGEVAIDAHERKGMLEICIKDTGIGIPKDKQEKIFEHLYQVDSSPTRAYGGTGMGLAITKEIIEAHRGKIRVESEPDKWSKFYINLPI